MSMLLSFQNKVTVRRLCTGNEPRAKFRNQLPPRYNSGVLFTVCCCYFKTSCLPLNNKHAWAFGFPTSLLMRLVIPQGVWTGYPRQGLWRWSGSVDHHFPEFRTISAGALWALHGAKKIKGRNKPFPNHRWGKWVFFSSEVLSFNDFPPTHWNLPILSLVIEPSLARYVDTYLNHMDILLFYDGMTCLNFTLNLF